MRNPDRRPGRDDRLRRCARRDGRRACREPHVGAVQQAGDEGRRRAGGRCPARMDADPRLQSIFGDDAPSSVLTSVDRSLCADFDGDGDVDRAALYKCCTVSSPSPIAILRNEGGAGYAIAYARLSDAVFSLRAVGRDLVARSPKYAPTDANCCPSRISERRIHWTGTRFKTTVRIRKAA